MNWDPLKLFFAHVAEELEGTPAAGVVTPETQNVDDVAPAIAEAAANAALSAIPGGSVFEGLADDVIPLVIGKLFDKASPAGQVASHKIIATKATAAGTVAQQEIAAQSAARIPGVGEIEHPSLGDALEPIPSLGNELHPEMARFLATGSLDPNRFEPGHVSGGTAGQTGAATLRAQGETAQTSEQNH
jgi:hypothetical protein